VVELKNDDVLLSAVDARMAQEVVDRTCLSLGDASGAVAVDARPLALDVVSVVPPIRFGEALAAPALELVRLGSSDWRELIEGLRHAAARTGLHPHT